MKVTYLFWASLMLVTFCSCFNARNAISFNIRQDAVKAIQYPSPDPQIQKNDLLNIMVSSKSAEASQIYNLPNAGSKAAVDALGGYLVNEQGNIMFPGIGSIKAEGLTKMALQDTITRIFNERKLLLDPVVSVRNLNYKITVLGEVLRPGVVNVPTEKINMLEALGAAGDMTIYANRRNVLLIREENNQRIFKVMDLNTDAVFSSPYFYLKPNDVIYVEPNRTKIASVSAARQWLPVVFSAISLAIITIYRLR